MLKVLPLLLIALLVAACDGQQTPITSSSSSSGSSSSSSGSSQVASYLPPMQIDVLSRQATIAGPNPGGGDYDLLVSSDSDCRLATYSTCPDVQWLSQISLPYTLKNLKNGQNYWGQLFQRGKSVTQNTGFRPDAIVANSTIQQLSVAEDGRYLVFDDFYSFTHIGPRTGPGIVVDSQSGQPGAFPLVQGDINTVISDENGGWYIGGSFTSIGGVLRKNIAHINAKGQVTAFNPEIDGPISKLLLAPDGVLVLGEFSEVNLGVRNQIALITPEGKLHDWAIESNGSIRDMLLVNNTLYISGGFRAINQTARIGVAALQYKGALTEWNPSKTLGFTLDYVTTLGEDKGSFYLAGKYVLPGQKYKDNLIAVDTLGKRVDFNPDIGGSISAVAVIQNSVYIGGRFFTVNGEKREFLASLTKTGQLNPWNTDTNAPVLFIREYNNRIYLAGHFDVMLGVPRSKFAALNMDGTLADWNPRAAPDVNGSWDNNSPILGAQLAFWQDKAYLAAHRIEFFGGLAKTDSLMLNQDGSLVAQEETPQNRIYGRVDISNSDTFEYNDLTCAIDLTDWNHLYSLNCPKAASAINNIYFKQYDDATAVSFATDSPEFARSLLLIPRYNGKARIYGPENSAFSGSIGGQFQKDEIRVTEQINNFITTYQIDRIFVDSAGITKKLSFKHSFNGKPLKAANYKDRILVGGLFSKIGETNVMGLAAFTKEGILIKSVKFPEVYTSVGEIQIKGDIMYIVLGGATTATIDLSNYPDLINQ
jgi:hypothetical protein